MMTVLHTNHEISAQELQGELTFTRDEVLTSAEDVMKRKELLYTAMILGNNYGRNVLVVCSTTDGLQEIKGRVWAMTDKDIMLKSGLNIPLHSIKEVEMLQD